MRKLAGFRKKMFVSACVIAAFSTLEASAQVGSYYDNNVIVDLSVLDDNGRGPSQRSMGRTPSPNTKLPPVGMPKSTFHGLPSGLTRPVQSTKAPQHLPRSSKPGSRIVLNKPKMQPRALPVTKLATTKPKSIISKVAKVQLPDPSAPLKIEVQATQVAPAPVAAKVDLAKASPPKPVRAPSVPVQVEKAKPLEITPPKTLTKTTPKPIGAPAKVMAEAPPPPPPSAIEPKKINSAMKAENTQKSAPSVASLPPASQNSLRISFKSGKSKLPASSQTNLKELADHLRARADNRVQLLAYAGGENLSASKARRLSLSRALAVRSYLIGQGVRSTRIDVRALGNKTTEEPFDRVDVQIAPR